MTVLDVRMHFWNKRQRRAFTLVEMLVVIGIIGILVALTAFGVSKVVGNQRSSNTQTAMRTIQKVLNEHWAYVVDEARKETGLEAAFEKMDLLFGPDMTGGERNRIIWIKMRLMEAFPTSYGEISAPFPYVANIIPSQMKKYNSTYKSIIDKLPTPNRIPMPIHDNTTDYRTGLPGHFTESSACLLMALSVQRNGTALNFDVLGSSSVADTDGDGITELVDAWGNPLSFFRFPTPDPSTSPALQKSNPATGAPRAAMYADPTDPGGVLLNWQGPGRSYFETKVHKIAFSPKVAYYILPTLVSWGPDGDLNAKPSPPVPKRPPPVGRGLDNNMSIVDAAYEADNIYSFQLR